MSLNSSDLFKMQTFDEVLVYLYEHLPYYQRIGPAAYKNNLDNTLALDKLFGHPHHKLRTIHVAGTNGKGSVSHMLASVFTAAGYKTGLYTSPHLKDFRERIKINGEMIDKEFVVHFVNQFIYLNEYQQIQPSFFELTVMLAFEYFAQQEVDVAIIEVGLGGRLDSTNIISPDLSIITNISLDHTALLGDTLGRIALEKGGIIKNGIPVVIGETHPQTSQIFEGIAKDHTSAIVFADQQFKAGTSFQSLEGLQNFNIRKGEDVVYEAICLDLLGWYQSKNICTVLSALELLKMKGWQISEGQLRSGLRNVVSGTGLLGRWQVIGSNPRIICDTGHNEGGIREVLAQLKQIPFKTLHMVIGMVNDKEIGNILALLPKEACYYFTKASIPRALDEIQLKSKGKVFNLKGDSYPTVFEAVQAARQNAMKEDLIFIGGSTFVVAEVL